MERTTTRPGRRRLLAGLATTLMLLSGSPGADQAAPRVALETSKGEIVIKLAPDAAPATVDNFLHYVDDGFYAGTIFHRVIPDFMIQGGGLDADLERRETRDPVVNESDNGLSNERGTIAMARTSDPDSATSQFFINLRDNARLDGGGGQPGYTVFGRVIEGMAVVDAIARVPTRTRGGRRNVPAETIVIEAAERVADAQ